MQASIQHNQLVEPCIMDVKSSRVSPTPPLPGQGLVDPSSKECSGTGATDKVSLEQVSVNAAVGHHLQHLRNSLSHEAVATPDTRAKYTTNNCRGLLDKVKSLCLPVLSRKRQL